MLVVRRNVTPVPRRHRGRSCIKNKNHTVRSMYMMYAHSHTHVFGQTSVSNLLIVYVNRHCVETDDGHICNKNNK